MKPTFKEVKEIPMEIMEGRYYHTMGFIRIPMDEHHLFGGDITWLLWRLDDEPESWRFTYRFRWYNTPNDPDDQHDEKSWFVMHITDTSPDDIIDTFEGTATIGREVFFKEFKQIPEELTPPDRIVIQGDHKQFMAAVKAANKSWMHMTEMTKEEYEKRYA